MKALPVSRRGEGDLRVANPLRRLVRAELLGDKAKMPAVAQQRAHGGPLVRELAETRERPVLDGRLASKRANGSGTDSAFQMGVQVCLGQ